MTAIVCPYCGKNAELVKGSVIYEGHTDLHSRYFWLCAPCDAYVGCHKGGKAPFGSLANARLRSVRRLAHRYFDPLWRSGVMSRTVAYIWLARRMGLAVEVCHVGMFTVEQCNKCVETIRKSEYSSLRNQKFEEWSA